MKITGLDGRTYQLKLHKYYYKSDNKSSLHKNCRALLTEIFPFTQVFEEVHLPGSGGLKVDFYLPKHNLMIEVQGSQHENYTPFYHGEYKEFEKSRYRDDKKREWCLLNDIRLIELNYNETKEEWKCKINRK